MYLWVLALVFKGSFVIALHFLLHRMLTLKHSGFSANHATFWKGRLTALFQNVHVENSCWAGGSWLVKSNLASPGLTPHESSDEGSLTGKLQHTLHPDTHTWCLTSLQTCCLSEKYFHCGICWDLCGLFLFQSNLFSYCCLDGSYNPGKSPKKKRDSVFCQRKENEGKKGNMFVCLFVFFFIFKVVSFTSSNRDHCYSNLTQPLFCKCSCRLTTTRVKLWIWQKCLTLILRNWNNSLFYTMIKMFENFPLRLFFSFIASVPSVKSLSSEVT